MVESTITDCGGWQNCLSMFVVVGGILHHCMCWLVESSITVCDGRWNHPSLFVVVSGILHHCFKNKTLSYPDHVFLTLTFHLSLMMQRK
jgi:hypothetical protein